MPVCSSCGAPVEGEVCPQCGAPAGQLRAGSRSRSELAPNVAAALCYIPGLILAIMFLWWDPYRRDRTIRFHAWQAILLQAFWIIATIVLGTLFNVFAAPLWATVERLLNLVFILLTCYMIFKAFRKRKVVLPYIGPLAEKGP
jgi:uncharacterized membrane protein